MTLDEMIQQSTTFDVSGQDYSPLGLPSDTQDYVPQGFQSAMVTQPSAPQISSAQGIWDTIKQDSSGAIDWAEHTAKDIWAWTNKPIITIPNPMDVLKEGEEKVEQKLNSIYWYGIIAVVVLVGGIYFIGKSGAIGQAASFGR